MYDKKRWRRDQLNSEYNWEMWVIDGQRSLDTHTKVQFVH